MARARTRSYPKGLLTRRWNREYVVDSQKLDPKEIETGQKIYYFDREGTLTPESERQYFEITLAVFEFYRVKYFDWQHLATALMFNHIPALQRSKGISRGRPKTRPLEHLLWLSRAQHVVESSNKELEKTDVLKSLSKTYRKSVPKIKGLLDRAEKWEAKEKLQFSKLLQIQQSLSKRKKKRQPPLVQTKASKIKRPSMTVHKLFHL